MNKYYLFAFFMLLCMQDCVLSSLLIHFKNGTIVSLSTLYTTLGNAPKSPLLAYNITLAGKHNVKHCSLQEFNTEQTNLQGHVIIYDGYIFAYKEYPKCIPDNYANAALFTDMAEKEGAVGVIGPRHISEKKYYDGRMTGITSSVHIPYIVAEDDDLKYLKENVLDIEYLEFAAVSKNEQRIINEIHRAWYGLRYANIVIYSILMMMILYLIVIEYQTMRTLNATKKKETARDRNVYRNVFGISAFFHILVSLVFVSVDPNNFELKKKFSSVAMFYLTLGSSFAIYVLVLRIWARVTGNALKSQKVKYFLHVLNVTAGIEAILTILAASMASTTIMNRIFIYYAIALGTVCMCGYVYCGKNIVTIFWQSGLEKGRAVVSLKIIAIAFMIVCMVVLSATATITRYVGSMLSVVYYMLLDGIMLGLVFALLFIQIKIRRNVAIAMKMQPTQSTTSISGSNSA